MKCIETYETGLLYHHYANTAYPLTPQSFKEYRLDGDEKIDKFVRTEWKNVDELSLYIHVPFCKSRCKFCEYVVLDTCDAQLEDEYVDLLLKEMSMYAEILKGKRIVGYDLGGGTPAKLSVRNLKRLTDAVTSLFSFADNVVFSVETTPLVAAQEPEKIKALFDMGYARISMGIQTVSEKLLEELGRDGSTSLYEKAMRSIRDAGYERFNIDLMYGFLHQTDVDFKNTLKYAIGLNPEYITLYRNRYKGTKLESEAGGVSIYKALYQYRIAYRLLTENGYEANVGKNTFSRVPEDYGTSDYLTKRVIYGTPYVGMGLGAQSFGMNYLAYNLGAAEKRMERYKSAILAGKLPLQDIYDLPKEESIAKMVSVAFYFAFVDLNAFKNRFGVDFESYFAEEIAFVIENGLMEKKDDRLYLTERGADFINGVIPLFYSKRSKKELNYIFEKRHTDGKSDEELFLESYDIKNYEQVSATVDVAAFALQPQKTEQYRQDDVQTLSLLLVKRGEHPYMNKWALPGGFLRGDEKIKDCAYREIREETGVVPNALMQIGTFSEPNRDPRGRIISNAFVSIMTDTVTARGGDDAIDARWFDVDFIRKDGRLLLTLSSGDLKLTATLYETQHKFGQFEFEIEKSDGLAFDHANIIATALSVLQVNIVDFDMIFDFMPEKFTLASLQRVQETILNISILPANFRRKASAYIEETNEYTEGSGHRPAQLFRKKMK